MNFSTKRSIANWRGVMGAGPSDPDPWHEHTLSEVQRHLAPTHSSVQTLPAEQDELVIKDIPDIFVAGHSHKCAVSYYNNILLISNAGWEDETDYQKRFGVKIDFCKVPMFNLKTRAVKILDFEKENMGGLK